MINPTNANRAARRMREVTMLQLLSRPLREAVAFVAFKKIRNPTRAERNTREQGSVFETKSAHKTEMARKIKKNGDNLRISYKLKLVNQMLAYREINVKTCFKLSARSLAEFYLTL